MELEIPEAMSFLTKNEVWLHNNEQTTFYREVDGISPEITNHLSFVRIEVIGGTGVVATDSMHAQMKEGSIVDIPPGHKYQYSGEFACVSTVRSGFRPNYVTIGDEKLGKKEQKIINRIRRDMLKDEIVQLVLASATSRLDDIDTTMWIMRGAADMPKRATQNDKF